MHKSAIGANDPRGLTSNERLEFLGDSVLNCLVTEYLYHTFPLQDEGGMSKMKSLVVSRSILGEVANSIELGSFMTLGISEKKTGGHKRKSIMSNAFEAVAGAIYLDGGLDALRKCIGPLLLGRIDEFVNDERHVNYKSMILEMSQRDGLGIPRYTVLETSGPEHAKKFSIGLEIGGVLLGKGHGMNKKLAQQNAAQQALASYDRETLKSKIQGDAENELLSDRRTADDCGHGTGDSTEEDSAGKGTLRP
jgi:ribonuclease-3